MTRSSTVFQKSGLMKISPHSIGVALLLVVLFTTTSFADTYHVTNFSGQLGSSPNIKSPFNTVLAGGGTVSGSFVFDDQQIPGTTTGVVNVFYSSFPDINLIPTATAFTLNLGGPLTFTLADATGGNAAIQYNHGNFNGFFFVSDFTFQGNPYELQIQGGVFGIVPIVNGNPTFTNLVSGTLNIGNSNLSGTTTFTPSSQVVPEPSGFVLLRTGLAGLVHVLRKVSRK